jgi:hypothetical protein
MFPRGIAAGIPRTKNSIIITQIVCLIKFVKYKHIKYFQTMLIQISI